MNRTAALAAVILAGALLVLAEPQEKVIQLRAAPSTFLEGVQPKPPCYVTPERDHPNWFSCDVGMRGEF